jgi:hypothetical protein
MGPDSRFAWPGRREKLCSSIKLRQSNPTGKFALAPSGKSLI